MKTRQSLVLVFTTLLLIVCIISISFAWYSAEVLDNMISDLSSEGVSITLTDNDSSIKPIIMKEGVIIPIPEYDDIYDGYVKVCDGYVAPVGWDTNEAYYLSLGSTYSQTHAARVVVDKLNTLTLSFSITYVDALGNEVVLSDSDISNYFELSYSLSNNLGVLEHVDGVYTLESGTYDLDLAISVSYRLPDELLPSELVNSNLIKLSITANLS